MKRLLSPSWVLVLAVMASGCAAATTPAATTPKDASLTAITTETLEPYSCGGITRMHTLGGVFLASQPSAADFEQAKVGGVKTVINLRLDSEQSGFDERATVTGLGLAYVHLPWNGAEQLTDEVFTRARELLSTAERPLLVHCASANRVGALWIPWRVLDGGRSLEEAVAEAKTIGLKTGDYEAKARDYVARNARR
ncbi:MAG: hypothetical protein HOP15_09290 [Planctomycetes bacterium]|nr:hypothetical protein [Planctomycetota bacterium]